ncbi:hypothetical protein BDV27DRAFT_121853 [Aspergillus caelatus]|uniref:Uncharacterized protein n=1 Tax=Aspergillus caelatus TaxID=61420 RepID=A0A5N7AI84_9EURO|nr:uncharacterized protein BDV27DRAFT_121853 [Aspergillus caelatus]KAE8368709.1 hypothetical protein BDV27DRAFT_121853 [Aspergillus caelatus]
MRRANRVLGELSGSPCPFAAFGTAVVNHTDNDGLGDLICIGFNQNRQTGNPSLHGEIAAITNCTTIRWAGFKEYVYGTSIDTLVRKGWSQIHISSLEVFRASLDLMSPTVLIGDVLVNETDPYFLWQFDPAYPYPDDCSHSGNGTRCRVFTREELR